MRLTARRGAPLFLSLALLNLGFVSAVLAVAGQGAPGIGQPVAQESASPSATPSATLPPATEIPLPTPAAGGTPTPTPRPSASRAPSTDTEP